MSDRPAFEPERTRVQGAPPASTADIPTQTLPQKHLSSPSSGFAGDLRSLVELLEHSQLENGPTVVRGYKLLDKIGQGGFGCVWQALNLKTEETVAIKFLVRENRDTAGILDEVKFLARVQGQTGVIPVKEVEDSGVPPHFVPYCVMQFAANGSLQDMLKNGPLAAGDAVRMITPIVTTLKFIHDRQIVHSDLKLANILLNEANEPLIADFGQAQRHTQSSGQGTLYYMAPERATIEKLRPDPRWDVYSLGAMLYALLVGHPPRQSEALKERIQKALEYEEKLRVYREGLKAAPKPVEHWKRCCDPDLARIIDRCLAPEADARPCNAGEVLKLLERRRYLRRMKPMIRFGLAATIGFFGLVIPVSAYAALHYLDQKRTSIENNVKTALEQKASLGCQIIEDFIAERVNFTEYHANNPERCPAELRLRLEKAARMIQNEPRTDKLKLIPDAQREYFDNWLTRTIYPVLARRHPESRKSLTLHVVVEDPGNPEKARGFVVSRLEGNAAEFAPLTLSPQDDRKLNEDLYRRNIAHRDYFNGQRNCFERSELEDAFPVIQQTHISHAYLSYALSREADGRAEAKNHHWKLAIATPIWAETPVVKAGQIQRSGKVVGLLVCGVFVEDDLEGAFAMPSGTGSGASEFVLVNNRGAWVLHGGAYRSRLCEDEGGRPVQKRDPQKYNELAREFESARGSRTATDYHTLLASHTMPADKKDRAKPVTSLDYVDLLKADQGWPAEIASLNRFNPFRNSYYAALRESGAAWTFIAQVDRGHTLDEVDEIRGKLLTAALYIIGCLLAVVVLLWVWLIRLVNRGEFAGHG